MAGLGEKRITVRASTTNLNNFTNGRILVYVTGWHVKGLGSTCVGNYEKISKWWINSTLMKSMA